MQSVPVKRRKKRNMCYACGDTKKDNPSLRLHRFPLNTERCKLWIEKCGLFDNLLNYDLSKWNQSIAVCTRHFEVTAYMNTNDLTRLNRDAVPTLFGDQMRPATPENPEPQTDQPIRITPDIQDQPTRKLPSYVTPIVAKNIAHKEHHLVCCVPGCERSVKKWNSGGCKGMRPVLLIPSDDKMTKAWQNVLPTVRLQDLAVCEIHFLPDAFCPLYPGEEGGLSYYKKIRENAVPSLYLDEVKNIVARAKCDEGIDWWKLLDNDCESSQESSDIGFTFITNNNQCDSTSVVNDPTPDIQNDVTLVKSSSTSVQSGTKFVQWSVKTEPEIVTIEDDPPNKKLKSDIEKQSEVVERKNMQLFRTLCSTPLELPSSKWGVHIDLTENNLMICEMSYKNGEFCIEKGVRLTPDLKNVDIRFQGTRLKCMEKIEINNVNDLQKLVALIDST